MSNKPFDEAERAKLALNDIDPVDKQLVMDAVRRGISRREMLTMLGAAGMTAASAGSLFTSAGEALAAMPKKGGKVRVALDLHGPVRCPRPATFHLEY